MSYVEKHYPGVSQDRAVVTHAQEILAKHARSFRLASLFLPKDKANDAAVVYAFCRLIDDAVDEAPTPKIAEQNITELKRELDGQNPRTEVAAFLDVAQRLSIPIYVAHDLMDGVFSDLGTVIVSDDAELARYCYRVAGTVGIMMCGVLGVDQTEALPAAVDLGLAMQITNICRDVLEDAQRGRVYLPNARLQNMEYSAQQILDGSIERAALRAVVDSLLELAEQCYARARKGMHYIPFRARLAILIARRVYRAIGLKLQRRHHSDPFHGRTIVSKWEKIWHVGLGILDFLDPRTWGVFRLSSRPNPFYGEWIELRGE